MQDTDKTKAQLIRELIALRRRVAELEDDALASRVEERTTSGRVAPTPRTSQHSARKHTEEALQASQERISAISNTAADGIITITEQGLVESFNPAAERIFGYPAQEVMGRNITMLMPTPYHKVHDRYLAQYRCTGEKHIIGVGREVVGQRKDGTTFPMDLAVGELHLGDQRLFTGFVRDLTARKQVEEALQRERDFAEHLIDTAHVIVLVLDTAGKIVRFNRYMEEISGYRLLDVQSTDWFSIFVPARNRDEMRALFAQALDGTPIRGNVNAILTKDRRERLIEWYHTPLKDAHGQTLGLLSTGQDITTRQRAAHELRRVERLALVGQLASGLAHEIGTPLNVIAGNAEFVRLDLRARGIPTAELDIIVEQADRISRLIEQLLTFARAKPQPMEPLALREPLGHALRLLETRFRREAITTTIKVPGDLPLVWGRADQLEQVFLNVLVNAWHAMPDGGTVTIQAGVCNDQCVWVAFRDTGVGMSATELARAFEPFYSTKGEKGTGLGLAMCQQVIESHHGTIHLDSTPGAGTTVTIALVQADTVT